MLLTLLFVLCFVVAGTASAQCIPFLDENCEQKSYKKRKGNNTAGITFDITSYDSSLAYNGTTLFAYNYRPQEPRIIEVDMEGNVVWEYKVPSGWMSSWGSKPKHLMDVERLIGGNTLFNINGSGVYEINHQGEVVWKHQDSGTSHDVDRLSSGNTLYARGWASKGEPVVIEVSPSGEIVWQWNGITEFDHEPYAGVNKDGWMHVNAVTRFNNGNTLISIRNFHMVVEINPEGRVVWKQKFLGGRHGIQHFGEPRGDHNHEPEIQPEGTMLVAVRKPHKVHEIDLRTGEVIWGWKNKKSKTIRDVDRLPNGNTLIQDNNKLTEITPDKKIVWQLTIPGLDWKRRAPQSLYKAQRIGSPTSAEDFQRLLNVKPGSVLSSGDKRISPVEFQRRKENMKKMRKRMKGMSEEERSGLRKKKRKKKMEDGGRNRW